MCGGPVAAVSGRKQTVSSGEATLTGEQDIMRLCPPVSIGQPELSPDSVPLLRQAPPGRSWHSDFLTPLRLLCTLSFQTT